MAIDVHSDVPPVTSSTEGVRSPPQQTGKAGTGRGPGWVPPVVCVALYALFTILLFGHVGSVGSDHIAGPRTVDQVEFVWWLRWAEYALWHGHNPFLTNWQNYPVGLNAGVNTSMLALGTAVSPITRLFGPVVAWNVLVRAAVFASAVSMCLVLRRWVRWWPAAFAGGLLYGFSAYSTYYGAQVADLSFVALPPLLFLIAYEIVYRQRWRAGRAGIAFATVCAAQFLISAEILASSILMAVVGCACFAIPNRRAVAVTIPYLKRALVAGLATGAVLLAYPLGVTLIGPGHIDGTPDPPNGLAALHGDLLGPVVPGGLMRFGTPGLSAFWSHHLSNSAPLYLGIPFLVAIAVTVVLLRRRGIVLIAGALAGCALILSLGSTLYVAGHDTHVPLPFVILAHLPVTDGFLATRFSLFTVLFGSAVLAIGIDSFRRRMTNRSDPIERLPLRRTLTAYALALLVVLGVGLPLLPAHTEDAFATGGPTPVTVSALSRLPPGAVVLAYPYPDAPLVTVPFTYRYESIDDVILDQAITGLGFKVMGSYGFRPNDHGLNGTPGPSDLRPSSVQALFASSFYGFVTPAQHKVLSGADLRSDLRAFMRRYRVDAVVVLPLGRAPQAIVDHLTGAIGPPSQSDGVTVWYDVPGRLGAGPS